jgi:hypothetical protein
MADHENSGQPRNDGNPTQSSLKRRPPGIRRLAVGL